MDKDVYLRLIKNQKSLWWFAARRKIINKFIKMYLGNKTNYQLLDFGAGSGANIQILNNYGNVDVYEKDKEATLHLKKFFLNKSTIKIIDNVDNINFYDLILLADVIEHFENDKSLVEFLSRHLKPNGKLIVTVPAFQFLFSSYDIALHHYRRYSKSSLKKLFEKDFNILKLSYFNFFLFIPSCIVVLLMKILNIKFARKIQTTPNFFLNKLLYLIFASESFFLRFLSFPFGISLLIVVERKK